MKKLHLQLSCYNGSRYLPHLFASLAGQTFKDWHLFVIDNGSNPEEQAKIREALEKSGLTNATLYRVFPNIGFAGAHNFLFSYAQDAEYLQLLNDDAILEPAYLAEMVAFMDSRPECGSAEGRIFRWNFDEVGGPTKGKTTVVDSFGLKLRATGKVGDIGAGARLEDLAPPAGDREVFGVSGCLPLYRVAAAKEASMDGSLFDGSYISYKEDVDIAYRLRALGYRGAVVEKAVAYHRRSFGQKSKVRPGRDARYQSYRNHLWMTHSHYRFGDIFSKYALIIPFEIAKAAYWLLRAPSFVLGAIRDTWRMREHLGAKRRFVDGLRRIGASRPDPRHGAPKYDIAVVTVSHNEMSDESLSSLAEAVRRSSHRVAVVVADNNSRAYAANELVHKHIPEAHVLLRDADYGFGHSCNRGAREVDADWYFFLNPDTLLTDPDILDKMVAAMKADPQIGILGPKMFYYDGRIQGTCWRYPQWFMPLIQRSSLKQTGLGKRFSDRFMMNDFGHDRRRAVDWVQGSAMFIGKDHWRSLGGFDRRYFMYFEDIDLCRRTRLMGKEVVYDPSVTLKHAHGKESAKYSGFVKNLALNPMARAHVASWIKYLLKWRMKKAPRTG